MTATLLALALCGCGDQEPPERSPVEPPPTARMQSLGEETVMGIDFVTVPGGCFEMGSPPDERGRDHDEKLHGVCLDSFQIGRYEITNEQYRRFDPDHDSGRIRDRDMNGDRQPVVRIRFVDAMAFGRWLSTKTGHHYRLPTEAEWEYAARAGTRTRFFSGRGAKTICDVANGASAALDRVIYGRAMQDNACDDGFVVTASVGHYRPNPLGLYDMAGNVWEMTCSAYRAEYDGQEQRCSDPRNTTRLAYRGGAWTSIPYRLRAAARTSARPGYRNRELGFRLVRVLARDSLGERAELRQR